MNPRTVLCHRNSIPHRLLSHHFPNKIFILVLIPVGDSNRFMGLRLLSTLDSEDLDYSFHFLFKDVESLSTSLYYRHRFPTGFLSTEGCIVVSLKGRPSSRPLIFGIGVRRGLEECGGRSQRVTDLGRRSVSLGSTGSPISRRNVPCLVRPFPLVT